MSCSPQRYWAGYIASQNNQREGFPVIELNQLWVTGILPGAAAEDVEKKLTIPIEDAIEIVDGVVGFRLPSPKIAQPLLSTLIWRSTLRV